MPASIDRIRRTWDVAPTRDDKGLTLTLRMTAYDNGIMLDGVPINDSSKGYDAVHGWVGAQMVMAETINEFRKAVQEREREHSGQPR